MEVNNFNIIIYILLSFALLALFYKYVLPDNIVEIDKNRISTIDGLRGYLAIFVFMLHYVISYYWHITGKWEYPPQTFLVNLAEASVVMFFYISGYLFFRKIIKNDTLNIKSFYIKRFFRIVPVYYASLILIIFIMFYKQDFIIHESIIKLIEHILEWFAFLQVEINKFNDVIYINSGITWTLRYEILFYLAIPLLFILIKKAKIIFILLFVYMLYLAIFPKEINLKFFWMNSLYFVLFFMGYVFVHLEDRFKKLYNFDNNVISTVIALLLLTEIISFKNSYGVLQFLILGIVFALIILGNSFFGILNLNFSRTLGEISYSIYVIHGIILYMTFKIILKNQIPQLYYMPVLLIIVILISFFTYKTIELPMINKGKKS